MIKAKQKQQKLSVCRSDKFGRDMRMVTESIKKYTDALTRNNVDK